MGILTPSSGFDTFLYTSLGQDENGVPLSMLSVFARRDTDPWEEAAKLCRLPKISAVAELSRMLDAGAASSLSAHDQGLLAARLIALLPALPRDSPLALRAHLNSAWLNKRNAGIAYGVAILLLYLGLVWFNV